MTQEKMNFQVASYLLIIAVLSIPIMPVTVANIGTSDACSRCAIYNECMTGTAHYIVENEKMTFPQKPQSSKAQRADERHTAIVLCAARNPFAKGLTTMRKPRTKKDSFRLAEAKAQKKERHAIAQGYELCEADSFDFGDCPLIPVTVESDSAKRYCKTFLPDPEQTTLAQLRDAVEILAPHLVITYGSAEAAVTRYASRAFKTDFRNAIASGMTREISPLTMLRRIVADKALSAAEKQAKALEIVALLIPSETEEDD